MKKEKVKKFIPGYHTLEEIYGWLMSGDNPRKITDVTQENNWLVIHVDNEIKFKSNVHNGWRLKIKNY